MTQKASRSCRLNCERDHTRRFQLLSRLWPHWSRSGDGTMSNRKEPPMGVSIREKNNDGIWWVFVRHAGQRVSEQVGSMEDAELAKEEIKSDIRRGKYDIAAALARRAPAKQAAPKPTAI